MQKWIYHIVSLSLVSCSLDGWGRSQPAPAPIHKDFYINPKQEWFVETSYLLWKPYLENLDFANVVKDSHQQLNPSSTVSTNIKKPEFSWDSGVRFSFGRYLPHHDQWNISATMTYFYGDADRKIHVNPADKKGITPTYGPINNPVFIAAQKFEGSWTLNYFCWDLALARQVGMTNTITVQPLIGLRALLTYQDYKTKSFREYTPPFSLISPSVKYGFQANTQFWGVGPRVGFNLGAYTRYSVAFLGRMAGALIYGPSKIDTTTTSLQMPSFLQTKDKAKDKDALFRGNLEGALGLGWDAWVRNNTVRVAPTLLYEGTLWWNMNRYFEPLEVFSENHGVLALMGVTFNLQVDF